MSELAKSVGGGRPNAKTYTGKACRKCDNVERYESTGGCVQCVRATAREAYVRYPEKMKERKSQEYQNNKERHQDTKLRLAYGITIGAYNTMLKTQNGVCAICANDCVSGRRLCVDHCHVTGKIRGLLCVNCNRGIGNLRDDPILLRQAINYLESNNDE